jgi:hypothetical protein
MDTNPEPTKPGDAVERASSKARGIANQAGREARAAAERGADVAKRTAEAAAEATRRATEQTEDAVKLGLRVIADVQKPLTDIGIDQGRRMLDVTARMGDAYREAAERTADDVHALIASWENYGRGLQRWQHAWFDLFQQSIGGFDRKRQELLRCNSLEEFAGVQRDIYVDYVNYLLNAGTTLLQLAGQIAQSAAEPLQQRARVSARA